jgi:hypothetical protein
MVKVGHSEAVLDPDDFKGTLLVVFPPQCSSRRRAFFVVAVFLVLAGTS